MARPVPDLVGQQFGTLTVLAPAPPQGKPGRRRAAWQCRCVCGAVITTRHQHLTGGHTTSCGNKIHRKRLAAAPLRLGQHFGLLTVQALVPATRPGGEPRIRCVCACGRRVVKRRSNVLRGQTRSCGAPAHRREKADFFELEAECQALLRRLRRWAYRQWGKDGRPCDVEEYLEAGCEALVGILQRYTPARGVALTVYATPRLTGALRDAWEQVQRRRVLAPQISWRLGYGRPHIRALRPVPPPVVREPSAEMQRYLALLPRQDRALVWLWACGATPAAIALRLRYPSGQAVSNRLHYLMTKLRQEPCIQAAYAALTGSPCE